MLISPAEPNKFYSLGTVSSTPERYGADFLISTPTGLVGVQRKTVPDLVASIHDGRLQKCTRQLKSLTCGIFLIEGFPQFDSDGQYLGQCQWTRAQHYGLLWSLQLQGLWVTQVDSLDQSLEILVLLEKWLQKDRHHSTANRPKPKGAWGKMSNREFANWFLQGLDGIGSDTADSIIEHFGCVPLAWTVDAKELQKVKGVGKLTAAKLIDALGEIQ